MCDTEDPNLSGRERVETALQEIQAERQDDDGHSPDRSAHFVCVQRRVRQK